MASIDLLGPLLGSPDPGHPGAFHNGFRDAFPDHALILHQSNLLQYSAIKMSHPPTLEPGPIPSVLVLSKDKQAWRKVFDGEDFFDAGMALGLDLIQSGPGAAVFDPMFRMLYSVYSENAITAPLTLFRVQYGWGVLDHA